jgi:hypothetical protein
MSKGYSRAVRVAVIGVSLTFIPFTFNVGDFYSQAEAASANAGGKGNGGDNNGGGGKGNGGVNNGGGGGNISADANASAGKPDLSPSDLGRLNGFMNASSKALQKAAPNSAIGIIAIQYAGALSAYEDALANQGQGPAPALDDAAAILAKAANKPLSPEIVAAINERLAAENPDNLSLAGFANPTNDPLIADANTQLATSIAGLANTLQDSETNQGLGPIY